MDRSFYDNAALLPGQMADMATSYARPAMDALGGQAEAWQQDIIQGGQSARAQRLDPLSDVGFRGAAQDALNSGDPARMAAVIHGLLAAGAGAASPAVPLAAPFAVTNAVAAHHHANEASQADMYGATDAARIQNVHQNRMGHGQSLPASPVQNDALMRALRGR